jgi:hypothetical protein
MPDQVVFSNSEIESFARLLYAVADELAAIEAATDSRRKRADELKEIAAEMLMRAEKG